MTLYFGKRPAAKPFRMVLTGPALLLILGILTFSCSSDTTVAPTGQRDWFYEYEFSDNPGLSAGPQQVVILDILPGPEQSTHYGIPYQYSSEGGYLYAIPSDDPFIVRADILDRSGVPLTTVERGDGGVYLEMSSGNYTIKVYHDGSQVPEMGTTAFIYQQKAPTLHSKTASTASSLIAHPYPAYVALQFSGGNHDGQYLAVDAKGIWNENLKLEYIKVLRAASPGDQSNLFAEKNHLFALKPDPDGKDCAGDDYPDFAGVYKPYSWPAEDAGEFFESYLYYCHWGADWALPCPQSQDSPFEFAKGYAPMPIFRKGNPYTFNFPVQDMGDGTFTIWPMQFAYEPCSAIYTAENSYVYFTARSTSAQPDPFKIDAGFRFYRDGGKITQRDLAAGEVALYEKENYTGTAVVLSRDFSDTTLLPLAQVKSVAFGLYTDTTVSFYSHTHYHNLKKTVGINMPENLNIDGSDLGSIKVFDSKKVLIKSKKCPYCNLAGVSLSNLNLDQADLAHANLMNAHMTECSLKQANLSHALLHNAQMGNANLSGASLLNASLNSDSDRNLAAADLSNAYLQNVNCKGTDLGGVSFLNGSFHTNAIGYNQDGCAQDTDNPPFTLNCASAEDANITATNFSGAYLAGTDFSGTTGKGVNFSNAVLTGALFNGAHLDWEINTGNSTLFNNAFLEGTNFTNTTVEGAHFKSAYVDLGKDVSEFIMFFTIPLSHTRFKGFDNTFGDTPCVKFTYSAATVLPETTDSSNICPDGSSGPCSNAAWTAPLTPRDQSDWQNSKGSTQPQWCTEIDLFW